MGLSQACLMPLGLVLPGLLGLQGGLPVLLQLFPLRLQLLHLPLEGRVDLRAGQGSAQGFKPLPWQPVMTVWHAEEACKHSVAGGASPRSAPRTPVSGQTAP